MKDQLGMNDVDYIKCFEELRAKITLETQENETENGEKEKHMKNWPRMKLSSHEGEKSEKPREKQNNQIRNGSIIIQ